MNTIDYLVKKLQDTEAKLKDAEARLKHTEAKLQEAVNDYNRVVIENERLKERDKEDEVVELRIDRVDLESGALNGLLGMIGLM